MALISEGNCRLKELFNTRKCWAWTVSSTDGPFHWLSALLSQSLELPVSQTRYASHRSGQRIFIKLPGIWEEEEKDSEGCQLTLPVFWPQVSSVAGVSLVNLAVVGWSG